MDTPVGVAVASRDRHALGKVHRNGTGHVPTARRNRQVYITACGLRLQQAWPFPADRDKHDLCAKCWPT